MTSTRTSLEQKHDISAQQRNAASLFWNQLLHGERTIPQVNTDKTEPLKEEVAQLVAQKIPDWQERVTEELNSLIFEERHTPTLKIESKSLPTGILLRAVMNCKIPPAVIPNNVSMTFTDDNGLRVNNKNYPATQILNGTFGFFAKTKPQELSSKGFVSKQGMFSALKTKPSLLTLGLVGITAATLSTI
jgi:hypothetical protein